ncbi:hypothetical protein GCM10010430_48110 [Kitasatospora cystarginea]|uniref:Major facilitator superfamily (MFS) profile domain-containing protein n=1 Tax=Kitasatospora cystarginea TaxID=58350 RepID=A0ABN3EHJ7_9ACTN
MSAGGGRAEPRASRTFGGLLLLGGRAGDILGRRKVFITGVLVFGLASLLGGLARDSGMLLAARALQGIGGAISSPTAFALIATNFEEGPERNRAFGVFSAVAGSGAAIGLLAGGLLTEYLNWRWVLFVNVPIAVLIALAAPLYISESERNEGRFDLPGALTSTLGLVGLVYGFIRAASDGWGDSLSTVSFAVGAVLLATFLIIERRTSRPITPLHLFANRNRTGGLVMMLCLSAAMFGIFFYVTIFVQRVLDYSPLKTGVAFLPISVAIKRGSARLRTAGEVRAQAVHGRRRPAGHHRSELAHSDERRQQLCRRHTRPLSDLRFRHEPDLRPGHAPRGGRGGSTKAQWPRCTDRRPGVAGWAVMTTPPPPESQPVCNGAGRGPGRLGPHPEPLSP